MSANLGEGHAGDLAVKVDGIEIGHAGDEIDDGLDIVVEPVGGARNDELFGDQLEELFRLDVAGIEDGAEELLEHAADDVIAGNLDLDDGAVVVDMLDGEGVYLFKK